MSAPREGTIDLGYWVVGFVDLLGQRAALARLQSLPSEDDAAAMAHLRAALRDSLGATLGLRKVFDEFETAGRAAANVGLDGLNAHQLARAKAITGRRVDRIFWSDGIVLASPLKTAGGHNPILALWDLLCMAGGAALLQLAKCHPVRGGIDVGLGTWVDGQVYGPVVASAYGLESERAGYPRILVGSSLLVYLEAQLQSAAESIEDQFRQHMASAIQSMLAQDFDGEWIVDFAGAAFERFFPNVVPTNRRAALEFARRSRSEFDGRDVRLFERYSKLVRYLEARL
jgi:hypothetical protein